MKDSKTQTQTWQKNKMIKKESIVQWPAFTLSVLNSRDPELLADEEVS